MSHSTGISVWVVLMGAEQSPLWLPTLPLFNTSPVCYVISDLFYPNGSIPLPLPPPSSIHDTFAFWFLRSLWASFPSYCCLYPVPSPAGFCLYCFSDVVPHTPGHTLTCAIVCVVNLVTFLLTMSEIMLWINKVNTWCFFWFGIVPVILMWLCSQVTLTQATSSLCFLGFFFFQPSASACI